MEWTDTYFARVNADSDGDNTIVAAVTGMRIRVISYTLTATAVGIATVKSASTALAELSVGTVTTAPIPISFAGSAIAAAFQTAVGEALVFNTQVAQDVNGHLAYLLVG